MVSNFKMVQPSQRISRPDGVVSGGRLGIGVLAYKSVIYRHSRIVFIPAVFRRQGGVARQAAGADDLSNFRNSHSGSNHELH